MTTSPYSKTRSIFWSLLWVTGAIWFLVILGIPSGLVPLWLFGLVTVAAFIAAWWLNLRLVTMRRRREAGRCWKCGYELAGLDSNRCPECGVDV